MTPIRVSANSRPTAVAGAIAGMMREHGQAEILAIGANAVNQAVKSVAIARHYLLGDALDVVCVPSMVETSIDGQTRTTVTLSVLTRNHP